MRRHQPVGRPQVIAVQHCQEARGQGCYRGVAVQPHIAADDFQHIQPMSPGFQHTPGHSVRLVQHGEKAYRLPLNAGELRCLEGRGEGGGR